jgi:hypothetical protein
MYTYLIGWSSHNKYYYGVRYAKNSNPNELWKSYFTSSKHVKYFAEKHGDPDIIEIRKEFDDRDSAILWENLVLKRMNVVKDSRFLNATDNIAIKHPDGYNPSKNLEEWNKYRTGKLDIEVLDPEVASEKARKLSLATTKAWKEGKMNSVKPEDTSNYKNAAIKRWSDPKFKDAAKSRKWINKGNKSKMVLPDDICSYLNSGWSLGRTGG